MPPSAPANIYTVPGPLLPAGSEEMSMMRVTVSLSVFALLIGGCSPTDEQDRATSDTQPMIPGASANVEPDGETRRTAPVPRPSSNEPTASPGTMPEAVRGQWRENDLGRDPTRDDCNQTSQSNNNFGKVLSVNAGGYSLFEDGGRIIDVHSRTDDSIDATFDTTYADTPTRARRSLALQSTGALAVKDDYGDGRSDLTEYLRCP